jgi:hypothetical protein
MSYQCKVGYWFFPEVDKVKPDIENIRGGGQAYDLSNANLTFEHKISKIDMMCSVKPMLTEDLWVVQKQEFFNNMLYVRNVHLTKGQA